MSFTRQRRRSFLSLFPSFIHQNDPARCKVSSSVSLFLLEKKEKPKQKKRFHLFSVCDSEPRKHTDRTTKKGAPETFHINNTLSTQTTHNALSRHHFRIWWEKHEDDDDDDDAQRGGCDERSFIRRRRRRPRRKRRRASFFTIIEKKK